MVMHTCIISFITIFGVCLQLKFPNVSPYETAYGTLMMNLFIIEICFYLASLVVMAIQAASNNRVLEDLTNKIGLLLGTLSLILELLVLISPFGWIVLFFWSICLLCFLSKSWQSLNTLSQSAVVLLVQGLGEFRQTLIDWYRRMMVRNDEVDNMSIRNNGADTELRTQYLNISNDRQAAEHQSQDQNHTNGAEHVISIPDDS
ncbi:hypothetical protein ACLB2K_054233 [Fragaria x ananassa]